MIARLRMLWVLIRDSLWFIPALMTLFAAGLAILVIELEKSGIIGTGSVDHWFLGGGADGARGVLTAISGGLITVTGVVFSVTIVALQLASSQFTPRVLRNFTADRSNQVVLGVFIGTFTYSLLVLRVIRSDTADQDPFIPRIAVAIAVGLVLVSIAFLIFFINHASRSIQVSVILQRVTDLTLQHVERLFPDKMGDADREILRAYTFPAGEPSAVSASQSGYLQAVDGGALFALGRDRDLVIRMERHIGEFVLAGRPLASVWPADGDHEEVESGIRRAFVLGPERTPEQDVEFGIIEIADIAVKALSPGINDPTTALACVDRLSEILLALGLRAPPADQRTAGGKVHFIARHLKYERAVGLAFDQIRHFGADNPTIVKRLLDSISQLLEMVPPERRLPLQAKHDSIRAEAEEMIKSSIESSDVDRMTAE